jgi:hypothetical protein
MNAPRGGAKEIDSLANAAALWARTGAMGSAATENADDDEDLPNFAETHFMYRPAVAHQNNETKPIQNRSAMTSSD